MEAPNRSEEEAAHGIQWSCNGRLSPIPLIPIFLGTHFPFKRPVCPFDACCTHPRFHCVIGGWNSSATVGAISPTLLRHFSGAHYRTILLGGSDQNMTVLMTFNLLPKFPVAPVDVVQKQLLILTGEFLRILDDKAIAIGVGQQLPAFAKSLSLPPVQRIVKVIRASADSTSRSRYP